MPEMTFKKGEFQELRPTVAVRLDPTGKGQSTGDNITFSTEDSVEFDGYTLRRNGEEYTLANPRSFQHAIKLGWFVPISDQETVYVSKPAITKVRPADMGEMTEAEAVAASKTLGLDTNDVDHKVVSSREGFETLRNASKSVPGKATVGKGSTPIEDLANPQSAKVVAAIKKPASTPKVGTLAEVLQEEDGQEDASLSEEVEVVSDITPETVSPDVLFEAKLSVAKALYPGFNWDKKAHWKTRVKNAVAKGTTDPMFLKAVMAVEDESVKKEILKAVLG